MPNARAVERTILKSRTHGFMGASRAVVRVDIPADAFPEPPPPYPQVLIGAEFTLGQIEAKDNYEPMAHEHGPFPDPFDLTWDKLIEHSGEPEWRTPTRPRDRMIYLDVGIFTDDDEIVWADAETVAAYHAWDQWYWLTFHACLDSDPAWLIALADAIGGYTKTTNATRETPDGPVVVLMSTKWFYDSEKKGLARCLRRAMTHAPFPIRPRPAFPQHTHRARSSWPRGSRKNRRRRLKYRQKHQT